MIEEQDRLKLQLLSVKFYKRILPYNMNGLSIKFLVDYYRKQETFYQYQSGVVMSMSCRDVVEYEKNNHYRLNHHRLPWTVI